MKRTYPTQYDSEQEPIVLSKAVLNLFLKNENEKPGDLISLYAFYYYTAKWQKTNQPYATIGYVSKGLKIGEHKVRRIKKELIKLGLIEDLQTTDASGKITGHYVLVKFIWRAETVKQLNHPSENNKGGEKTTLPENHSVGNGKGNALSFNNKNALSFNNKNITKKKSSPGKILNKKADRVIKHLNTISGKQYRASKASRENIIARLRDGFTTQDCITVIDNKSQDPWFIDNPQFMRPQTLFAPTKFESYLNDSPKTKKAKGNYTPDVKYETKEYFIGGKLYNIDDPNLPDHIRRIIEED